MTGLDPFLFSFSLLNINTIKLFIFIFVLSKRLNCQHIDNILSSFLFYMHGMFLINSKVLFLNVLLYTIFYIS